MGLVVVIVGVVIGGFSEVIMGGDTVNSGGLS